MLEAYRTNAAERAAQGIPALPLSAQETTGLIELLKNPPKGEEAFLVDLLTQRLQIHERTQQRSKRGVRRSFFARAGFDDNRRPELAQGVVQQPRDLADLLEHLG